MSNLKAIKRETTSSGSINKLRETGYIPAILYGGENPNQKAYYLPSSKPNLFTSQISGKKMGYNNILDIKNSIPLQKLHSV